MIWLSVVRRAVPSCFINVVRSCLISAVLCDVVLCYVLRVVISSHVVSVMPCYEACRVVSSHPISSMWYAVVWWNEQCDGV